MKQKLLLIFFLGIGVSSIAQKQYLDTIFVNKNNNVNIVFPTPVQKAYTGNSYFSIIYEPNVDNVLILKAIDGPTSNLFVVTSDNLMYNFVISYRENIKLFYRMIAVEEAINFVKKSQEDSNKKAKSDNQEEGKKDTLYNLSTIENGKNLYLYDKEEAMRKICSGIVFQKYFFARNIVVANNVRLQLMNIYNNKEELYFYFEIENKIGSDYNIDYIDYSINTDNVKKRSNSQAQSLLPLYLYQVPEKVKGNSTQRFVVVFDKFTISGKKVFIVNIKEVNGERDIYIEIQPKQINNPNMY